MAPANSDLAASKTIASRIAAEFGVRRTGGDCRDDSGSGSVDKKSYAAKQWHGQVRGIPVEIPTRSRIGAWEPAKSITSIGKRLELPSTSTVRANSHSGVPACRALNDAVASSTPRTNESERSIRPPISDPDSNRSATSSRTPECDVAVASSPPRSVVARDRQPAKTFSGWPRATLRRISHHRDRQPSSRGGGGPSPNPNPRCTPEAHLRGRHAHATRTHP